MESIIEQLFNGEIDALEHFSRTDEYKKVVRDFVGREEEFLKALNEGSRDMYEELMDIKSKSSMIESKIHFSYGFKLGFTLSNELHNKESCDKIG